MSVMVGKAAPPGAVVVTGAGFRVTDGPSPFGAVVEGVSSFPPVMAAASEVVTPIAVEGPSLSDETSTEEISEVSSADLVVASSPLVAGSVAFSVSVGEQPQS
jgi:hypothetical protein